MPGNNISFKQHSIFHEQFIKVSGKLSHYKQIDLVSDNGAFNNCGQ